MAERLDRSGATMSRTEAADEQTGIEAKPKHNSTMPNV
jgi:hypothetical protein